MPSIKQIVPICFTLSFIIFPNFTFADNITASSTCTNGVLGTYTGPADIEANFDPNTINTTWYSNGTQLTGNNIPATCTYDNALIPPTPADRPGYTFGGWSVIVPPCEIPSSLVSNDGGSKGYKDLLKEASLIDPLEDGTIKPIIDEVCEILEEFKLELKIK